ncbi:hypothetical protein HK103_006912 [Boothiomyces macroporosus]|uniref:Oligopeptide transporter n=1 Tax=Boothiomyces macroporosus TaxID=261099 RepID=A0AAD5UQB0_9FUNG|nr:hypothetical protein HK103_006912 [Boothiomyces macroporosus]
MTEKPALNLTIPTIGEHVSEINSGVASPNTLNSFYGLETYSSKGTASSSPVSDIPQNSIIPEVAVTIPITDTKVPVFTIRVLFITTLLIAFNSYSSQFYLFRLNRAMINAISFIILSYPLGLLMEYLPKGILNPGKFNYKEHGLITVSTLAAYNIDGISLLTLQRLYYGNQNTFQNIDSGIKIGDCTSILFLLSLQTIGVAIAGFFTKFLVMPAELWYPENLVPINFINTFHSIHDRGISKLRMKAFLLVFGVGFVYEFFPHMFAPLLQSVSILCLAHGGASGALNPVKTGAHLQLNPIGQLGSISGGGIFSLAFDWTPISSLQPLVTPVWSQLNVLFANYLFSWVITPIVFYSNFMNAKNFKIYSAGTFYENGTFYNIKKYLVNDSLPLDKNVPTMWISPHWALCYGCAFAAFTSTVSYYLINYSKKSFQIFNSSRKEMAEKDVHTRLMQSYKSVPCIWYVFILAIASILLFVVTQESTEGFQMQGQFWVIPLATILSTIFILPIGILRAISNQSIDLGTISELIMGYLMPGYPLANATFKVICTSILNQGLVYLVHLKFGTYMKIPPRVIFFMQFYGIIAGSTMNYLNFDYATRRNDLVWKATHFNSTSTQWSARLPEILNSDSEIFGAISPQRFFNDPNTNYSFLFWFFLAGLLLPIITFMLAKALPRAGFHYINWPIIFQSVGLVVSGHANAIFITTLITIGTQYYLRKHYRGWYDKYNYIVAAGLDCAATLVPIIVFVIYRILPRTPQNGHRSIIPHYALNPDPSQFGMDYCGAIRVFNFTRVIYH